ncbi:MAG: ATP-binding protein [Lachnospiraceae bacterium]|nr:ATP-binding protein [Lachnospiraceae bacterium]
MTTFEVLYIFQIIAIIIGLVGIFTLFSNLSSPESKYLLTSAICSEIFAFGFLLEMIAKTEGEALYALYVQQIGLSYIGLLMSIYVVKLTNLIRVDDRIWGAFFFLNTIKLGVALTTRAHSFYYANMEFVHGELFDHIIYERTFLRIFDMSVVGIMMMFSFVVTAIATRRAKRRDIKRRYAWLSCGMFMTVMSWIFTAILGFEEYKCISAVATISFGMIALIKSKGKMYDPVEIGRANLFMNSTSGLVITDPDFNFLDANRMAGLIFPELASYDTGKSLMFIPEITKEEVEKEVFEFSRNDFYYEVMVKKIIEGKKDVGCVLVITNITHLKNQMMRIEELKEVAESASEAKTIFLANMSHEMRTPLNAVIGLSELSERESKPEQIKSYISQIKNSGQMLLEIVNDVLDFSKVESGKLEIVPDKYSVPEMISAVVNVVNVRLGGKELDFIVDVNSGIPEYLIGDDARIKQILVNFLSNAVKYTITGFVKLSVDYEKLDDTNISLMFSVEDSGKGIKEKDIGSLFKNFTRVDLKANRNIQGTGLGLAISGRLVELMGGKHEVTSEYGKGSKFSFNIPQEIASTSVLGDGKRIEIKVKKYASFELGQFTGKADTTGSVSEIIEKEEEIIAKNCENKLFLVVDDNAINIKVLQALLKVFRIESESAMSGQEAIDKFRERQYDMVFMDHMMPNMDGVEATSFIRNLNVSWAMDTPIIACTANAIKGVEEMFIENGMNDYIFKPIEMDDLKELLKKYFC